jgi:hypothetical protein
MMEDTNLFDMRSRLSHALTFEYDNLLNTMKTFQFVTLFALIAAATAFAPNQVPQGEAQWAGCLSFGT